MGAKPIPDGYHTVTPYLITQGAARAIKFYEEAFGAKEVLRLADPNGKVGHAEISIGDSFIMLADEHPEMGFRSPQSLGGSPVGIHLYVKDVDSLVSQAVAAGAKVLRAVQDQFYGDRSGTLRRSKSASRRSRSRQAAPPKLTAREGVGPLPTPLTRTPA
jgi:PhnB protein